ncbi:hypothetical protein EQ500_07210 [Lactobacillus sp. XV13L]|nr:hypothetical protein [Lactobacillus sp. XV13L]
MQKKGKSTWLNRLFSKVLIVTALIGLASAAIIGGLGQKVEAYTYVERPHASKFAYHNALVNRIFKKHNWLIVDEWIPVNCFMVTQHSGTLFNNRGKAIKRVPRGAQYKVSAISLLDWHAKYKIDGKHYIGDDADGVTYKNKQKIKVKRIKLTSAKLRKGIYKRLSRIGHRNGTVADYHKAKHHRDFNSGPTILDTSDTFESDLDAIEDNEPEFEDYGYHKAIVQVKIKKLAQGRVKAHVTYQGYKN